MKRICLRILLVALLPVSFLSCQEEKQASPNILIILVDDMGVGDASFAGNPYLSTPTLDSLAAHSVAFNEFYVSSVCAPTRASLLTGRYHQRTGVQSVTNGYEVLNPSEITLAEQLKDIGYRTGIFGKWHLGEYYPSIPIGQGFNTFVGFRTGHTNVYDDPILEKDGAPYPTKGYISDVLTQEALGFMSESKGTPFFCYLAHNLPHTPLIIADRYVQPFRKLGLDEKVARLYGMMTKLDESLTTLFHQMREKGLLENTAILFLSDNGPISGWKVPQEKMRFNAGLRDQKFTTYEGGIRTHAFWTFGNNWPHRRVEDTFGAHIDVVPTMMELIGVPAPEKVDGISLLSVLEGKLTSTDIADRSFFQNFSHETLRDPRSQPGGIMRSGPWKMVNGRELYRLDEDSAEAVNLANIHTERLAAMRQKYQSWWEEVTMDELLYPRPIPIGYAEQDPVALACHHARAFGSLKFTGWRGLEKERIGTHPTGVDGDWVEGWSGVQDSLVWEVETRSGKYQVGLIMAGQGEGKLILELGERKFSRNIKLAAKEWTYVEVGKLDQQELGVRSAKLYLQEVTGRLKVNHLVWEKEFSE
ncbi:MAG: sulfatase-like hydrolase/transferase [Bacteroidota bacterium]